MAKVNCDEESAIAKRFQITKYPTLKVIQNGEQQKREYRGQRSKEAFAEYVRNQLKDPIIEFSHLKDLEKLDTRKRIIVGYFDRRDMPEYNIFRRVAANLKDDCKFHVGFGDVVAQMHPPGVPIVVFRPDIDLSHDNDETYTGKLNSIDELKIWAQDKCVPLVRYACKWLFNEFLFHNLVSQLELHINNLIFFQILLQQRDHIRECRGTN